MTERAELSRRLPGAAHLQMLTKTSPRLPLHASEPVRWPPELLGPSAAIQHVRDQVLEAGRVRGRVLLLAERGFDAGAIARRIHDCGPAAAPFVAIDCASAEPRALDATLFGARSARVRARAADREGVARDSRLAAALGGTLYVAHLGEMPAGVQGRLARMLRDGEILLAGERTVPFDMRIVAGAGVDIDDEVDKGMLRGDLFRRFAAGRIVVPPLRERSEDVVFLTTHFAHQAIRSMNLARSTFTHAALASLASLPWPGNVVELREIVGRLCRASNGGPIRAEDVLAELRLDRPGRAAVRPGTLRDARRNFEREYIAAVLGRHGWRIADAAATLGIERANLYRKIRQIGLSRPSGASSGNREA